MQKKKRLMLFVIPVCVIVLGIAAGMAILFGTKWKKEAVVTENEVTKYSVSVKDEEGNAVKDAYVVLCSEDGKQISWLPYATNEMGNIQITDETDKDCFVKVIAAPLGYEIDEAARYEFNKNGKLTVYLKKGNIAYAAKIGETYFTSLSMAFGVANSSSEDVTVEILADATVKPFTFGGIYGNKITVNGNGFALTAEGGNNTFIISQEKGAVRFNNMTLKHKNTGSAFQITGGADVDITNVKLDATEGAAYNYALINIMHSGVSNLNLTNVDVKMAVGTPAKANEAGIIRTGNADCDKTVNITMNGCNFDTTGATGRNGMVIMKRTAANIKINNSVITAGDAYAIWNTEKSTDNTLTVKNGTFISRQAPYSATPVFGYEVRNGDVYYPTITKGIRAAEKSATDTTLTLINDLTINCCEINGKNGNLITIDGNGKTLTTDKGNNAFVVGNRVAFKNMNINHKNTGSVVQIKEIGSVDITDVNVNATEGAAYTYTLFNILAPGDTSTLNLTRVNVKMAVESKGQDKFASIIRTGNSGSANRNTVVINLTDCNLDTTGATGRSGISVVPDTRATVNLKNTKIATKDIFAIRSCEETINWNNADTVLTSLSETYREYPVEGYLAKIGDVFYTLNKAIGLANNAKSDTTINLLANYSLATQTVGNVNNKKITLNGNGKTVTTTGGNNAFVMGKNVAIEDLNIVHKNSGSVFQITEKGTFDFRDININATEGKEYRYALINTLAGGETTLTLNKVNAKMAVAGTGASDSSAIIRTGNDDEKTVNLNMSDCNLDTTAATGRMGIVVMRKTTANIKMSNTKISTLNEAPIRANEDSSLAYMLIADNCTFTSKAKEFNSEPIRGYDAKIGDIIYHDFKDALAHAKTGNSVELLQNFAIGEVYIDKSVTVNGAGHTLTASSAFRGGNTFIINKSADVSFKNMSIADMRNGSVIQIKAISNVSLENVDIDATKSKNGYDYCLINMLAAGADTTSLKLKSVNVKMAADTAGKDKFSAVIRTGNFGNSEKKKVNISLENCVLDATDAVGRYGIAVMDTTDAVVSLTKTKIKTQNVSAVKCFCTTSGQLTVDDASKLICGKKSDETDGYTYSSGNTYYVMQMEDIFKSAVSSVNDVTLKLQNDTTLNLDEFVNVNGKKISIDTNGYSLTTTGKMNKTVEIINTDAHYTEGEKSVYCTLRNAVNMSNSATANAEILILQNITTDGLQEFKNANGAEITVDGNGKTVTTTKGSGANNNAFKITSAYTGKNAAFKNMVIEHRQTQALFQVQATGVTLSLADIEVKTDKSINYQYGLINLEKTSDLVLERVNVALQAVSGSDKNSNAIIRTGNDSYPNVDNSKTVNITINDCDLDALGAAARNGILIMNTTKAKININNSNITVSSGAYVINRLLGALTSEDIKNNTDVYVEGESKLKAGTDTSFDTVIRNIDSSHIQAVRTVTFRVPVEFFDKFMAVVKSFADRVGWKLDI